MKALEWTKVSKYHIAVCLVKNKMEILSFLNVGNISSPTQSL